MATTESRSPRLAVLIDADNTSPRIAAGLFEEVAKMGEASVRRIYGDSPARASSPGPISSTNMRSCRSRTSPM
jgi:hypothetical protein